MKRMYSLSFAIAAALAVSVLILPSEHLNAHFGLKNGKEVYPNPFSTETNFQLTMPREAKIKIDVYNIRGQHVKNLYGGESGALHPPTKGAQGEDIPWDGRDSAGNEVPAGVYICVLQSEGVTIKSVKVVKCEYCGR